MEGCLRGWLLLSWGSRDSLVRCQFLDGNALRGRITRYCDLTLFRVPQWQLFNPSTPPLQPGLPQVYELSADICLLAGDLGEALKCLRQLVELIYSTLAAAQLQAARCDASQHADPLWHAEAPAAATEGSRQPAAAAAGECGGDSSGLAALLGQPCFARWPEAAGALLLYYKCHQQAAAEGVDTIITLRRLPSALLARKEVGMALQLVVALGAGDYVGFCRLVDQAPLMVQLTAQACLGQVCCTACQGPAPSTGVKGG